MSLSLLVWCAAAVAAYGVVSAPLARRSLTGPIVMTVVGIALSPIGLDLGADVEAGDIELLAEATLVMLLFTDATRIDLRVLRSEAAIPARMLLVGLPLTVLAGWGVGRLVFPDPSLAELALLAAVLTPTDAALGQAVVGDRRVPIRIRQALNVESGLNDGLMVPVITVLAAVVAAETRSTGDWARFAAEQVGWGLLVGLAVGLGGGRLLDEAARRRWFAEPFDKLATLGVAVGAYGGAVLLDGNGFVAAFVAGLAFGGVARGQCRAAADFAEEEGVLLSLLTFLLFGVLSAGPALERLDTRIALYVVASLTVVRVVPVGLSLLGVGLERPTLGVLGWFGPRGLASILFGVSVLDELDVDEVLSTTVAWTVLVSIVAHGLSAGPVAAAYGRWFAAMGDDGEAMPEGRPAPDLPTRSTGT